MLWGEKAMDQGLGIKLTHGITGDFGRPVCGTQERAHPIPVGGGEEVKRIGLNLGYTPPGVQFTQI